jgi:hypothetical protein
LPSLFRKFRASCELHWSMTASYATAEKPDAELQRRFLNTRRAILDLVADMLPTPGVPLALEDEAEPPPPSVH